MPVRGCLLAGVVALVTSATPVAAQEQVGRYTIVMNDVHIFLLDTAHGSVWQRVKFGEFTVWQFMYKLDNMPATQNFLQLTLPDISKAPETMPKAP